MTEPPGREIRRRLEAMKPPRSQGWLAMRMGLNFRYVSRIIRADIGISPRIAIKLARELGDEPEFWARLQADYDVAKARREMAESEVSTS